MARSKIRKPTIEKPLTSTEIQALIEEVLLVTNRDLSPSAPAESFDIWDDAGMRAIFGKSAANVLAMRDALIAARKVANDLNAELNEIATDPTLSAEGVGQAQTRLQRATLATLENLGTKADALRTLALQTIEAEGQPPPVSAETDPAKQTVEELRRVRISRETSATLSATPALADALAELARKLDEFAIAKDGPAVEALLLACREFMRGTPPELRGTIATFTGRVVVALELMTDPVRREREAKLAERRALLEWTGFHAGNYVINDTLRMLRDAAASPFDRIGRVGPVTAPNALR